MRKMAPFLEKNTKEDMTQWGIYYVFKRGRLNIVKMLIEPK